MYYKESSLLISLRVHSNSNQYITITVLRQVMTIIVFFISFSGIFKKFRAKINLEIVNKFIQTFNGALFLSIIIVMKSVYSEDNEVLQALWKEYNPEEEEYIQKETAIGWIKSALQKTNALSNFQQSLTDLSGLIQQYLRQAHEVNEQGLHNIQLSYAELVDFLNWLTNDEKEQVRQLGQSPEKNQADENGKQAQKQNENQVNLMSAENKGAIVQLLKEQLQKRSPKMKNKSIIKSQKKLMASRIEVDIEQQQQSNKQIKTEEKQENEDIEQNATSSPNQLNIEQLSKKYKDYVKVIFEHYCKISYATGQDPTFEQIKHKTTIMTINKFMIFCKDFQISKINELFNRNYLIQVFKKHAECYKQMTFQQFCQVIKKLATVGFYNLKQVQQKKEKIDSQLLTEQMVKILEFFEIQTAKKFKQKMKKLNIQYRIGPKTNAEMKVIPEGYRFKFTSNNGKSQDQIKQELQERKQHRSERKILLQQRGSNNPNEARFRKKVKSKNATTIHQKEEQIMKEINRQTNSIHSTNVVNKILTPPVPPPKRIANLPPNPPRNSNYAPSISSHQPVVSSPNANFFKKDISYAQIHKLKQNEGYSRKLGVNKSSSRQDKANFKLNSIVEEARLQVQENPQVQLYSDQLTESIGTNSREEGIRVKNYDLNKMNNKIQVINERNRRDRMIQEQLEGLLDMSNEEDEYLRQHLEREKKNDIIGKRLSQRINELQKLK